MDYHRLPPCSHRLHGVSIVFSVLAGTTRGMRCSKKKKLMALLFLLLDFWIHVPTVATAKAYWSFVFPSNIFHSSSFQFTKMFIHSHEQFVFGVNLSCVGCSCCNFFLFFPLLLYFSLCPVFHFHVFFHSGCELSHQLNMYICM